MDLKDIIEKVVNSAPLIGSFFGPGGTVIGSGIKLISSALGVTPTQDSISTALVTDPNAVVKLQEYEDKNRDRILEALRLELHDTQNARNREIEITKITGKRDSALMILAGFGIFLPFALVIAMILYGIPKMSSEEALMVGGFVGMIVGEYKTVYGYFFGSSSGSDMKTQLMRK